MSSRLPSVDEFPFVENDVVPTSDSLSPKGAFVVLFFLNFEQNIVCWSNFTPRLTTGYTPQII